MGLQIDMTMIRTCNENSYKDGNSCATAPTASSAIFIQSARDNDTIRGVKHDHSPASVTSLHPASSSSNNNWNMKRQIHHINKVHRTHPKSGSNELIN